MADEGEPQQPPPPVLIYPAVLFSDEILLSLKVLSLEYIIFFVED